MKRIKFYLAALYILLTGTIAVAQTSPFEEHTLFRKQTENWLQHSNELSTLADLSSESEDPPGEPNWPVPVGDALPFLFGLGLLYVSVKKLRLTSK
jgi:hypothetical protein